MASVKKRATYRKRKDRQRKGAKREPLTAQRKRTQIFRSRWKPKQKDGKRSGLETQVATQLDKLGVKYRYEGEVIHYTKPSKPSRYTPDFKLPNGIIVETKGRFVTADRQKHKLIKEQHPSLDIRFVFSNPNQRISKKSATTYGMWCEKHGFVYAKGFIPKEWLT